ncbi:MAG: response regulator [Lachnospiraceae bacterium]|nr:response regulator [Lachnospiraceae bacterium]
MRPDKRGFDIIIIACLSACILFTVCVYAYGQFIVHNDSLYDNEAQPFDAVWTYTEPTHVNTMYRAPDRIDVKGVTEIRLNMKLPTEISDGNCLFLLTAKDMDAYIDGELRNSYRLSKSVFGRNVKGMWVPITLRRTDVQKRLTVVYPDNEDDVLYLGEVFIGNRLGFAMMLINDNAFLLILAFTIIIFSVVISIACFIYRVREMRVFPLWFLSLGILFAAVWLIMDNYTYPLIFGNYFVDGITGYLVLMLLPFPFAAYICILLENRYRTLFDILRVLITADFVTLTVLHFLGIADFRDTRPVSSVVLVLVALYCLIVLIYDTFHEKHRENLFITIGFILFVILSALETVHIHLPAHTNDGIFVALAMLILLIVAVTQEVVRISNLRAKSLEAQSANQAKTTFLANMSHEIRTPIHAILGMDELILREDTDPKVREYALNIRSAGNALVDIISDVLDFSKIEQGRMDIINAEYESRLLISSIITMISVKSDEKGLGFVKDIAPDLPSRMIGDEKRLREILINLLNNAVKYTSKGSITLEVSHEKKDDNHTMLCITVKDTGIGIREEDRDKLFKRFERLDYAKTQSIEGSGLGLAISANLIKLMEGTIECESVYGKGTEFIVRIPQMITDPTPIGNMSSYRPLKGKESKENSSSGDLGGIRVLVVDDNDMNLKVANGMLALLKAKPTMARSGQEMLDLLTKEEFDVVLLDHMMPGMDGIEAYEKSLTLEGNLNPDIPYIALTANAIAGAKDIYLEHGFTDYLSKPMKVVDLETIIRAHIPPDRQEPAAER